MFAKFETVHPSKLSAFIDGLLCGALVAFGAFKARQAFLEIREEEEERQALTRDFIASQN